MYVAKRFDTKLRPRNLVRSCIKFCLKYSLPVSLDISCNQNRDLKHNRICYQHLHLVVKDLDIYYQYLILHCLKGTEKAIQKWGAES